MSASWTDARKWAGDMRRIRDRWPNELECQDTMMGIDQPSHFVPLRIRKQRRWIDTVAQSYRVYTPWCMNRDLHSVISLHIDQGTPIPEPFIWYVAETLGKCSYMMTYGHWPGPGAGPLDNAFQIKTPDWKSIVHRV